MRLAWVNILRKPAGELPHPGEAFRILRWNSAPANPPDSRTRPLSGSNTTRYPAKNAPHRQQYVRRSGYRGGIGRARTSAHWRKCSRWYLESNRSRSAGFAPHSSKAPVQIEVGLLALLRSQQAQLACHHGPRWESAKFATRLGKSVAVERLADVGKEKNIAGSFRQTGVQRRHLCRREAFFNRRTRGSGKELDDGGRFSSVEPSEITRMSSRAGGIIHGHNRFELGADKRGAVMNSHHDRNRGSETQGLWRWPEALGQRYNASRNRIANDDIR